MAKKISYVVGKNKSISAKGGVHLKPGEKVEIGKHIDETHVESMVRDGFLKKLGGKHVDEDEDEDDETPLPSEIDTDAKKPDPLKIGGSHDENKLRGEALKLRGEADRAKKVPVPASPWILDPEKLKDKSIDELNVMIRERDPKGPRMQDRAAAVSFLSAEFRGK